MHNGFCSYKEDVKAVLDAVITDTCDNIDSYVKHPGVDFTRNRKLNAETTIKITLNMQGNSLNAELLDAFPDIDDRMTASAYEQAKGKFTTNVFEDIFHKFNKTAKPKLFANKYRLYAIDGSDFNIPYNPKSKYVIKGSFGRPKKDGTDNKPVSLIHANLLYDLENKTYEDCILQSRATFNERTAALDMLKRTDMSIPSIVIMDRGYIGFNMIENLNRLDNCNYIIRAKAGNGAIKEIAELPDCECDKDITFRVTTSGHFYTQNHKFDPYLHLINHTKKHYKENRSKNTDDAAWDFEQFCNVKCRVVKFRINNSDTGREEWEVLVTNLNRFEFPVSKMKEMYHLRWDIETSFRELKYNLGAVNFHSKKDDFIEMELFAHFIMYNVVSRCAKQVSVPQTNHKDKYAIDVKMACLIVRKYFKLHSQFDMNKLLVEILMYINPIREGRKDKRNLRAKSAVSFLYRVA